MRKLLSAGFARLKRDKVFWICTAILLFAGAGSALSTYGNQIKMGEAMPLELVFFNFTIFLGMLSAIFGSLFLGTEYSDGTIRNKLVVGHSRNSIYLSNFILTATAGLLMNLAYIVTVSAVGIPLLGFLQTDLKTVALLLLGSITMTLAFSAIFTSIGMLNQNKAMVAVICIVGVVVLMIGASWIQAKLDAPEFFESFTIVESVGNDVESVGNGTADMTPNPMYLRGAEREMYQFAMDFLPTGQAFQIAGMSDGHLWQMLLYSLLTTASTTVSGMFFFRRKDLK